MCERGIRAFLLCISAIPRSYSGSGILNRDAEGEEMPRLLVNGKVIFDLPDMTHETLVGNSYLLGIVSVDMSRLDPEGDAHLVGISVDGMLWNVGVEDWMAHEVLGEVNVVLSHEGVGSFCLEGLQGVLETHNPVRHVQNPEPTWRTHWSDRSYFVR